MHFAFDRKLLYSLCISQNNFNIANQTQIFYEFQWTSCCKNPAGHYSRSSSCLQVVFRKKIFITVPNLSFGNYSQTSLPVRAKGIKIQPCWWLKTLAFVWDCFCPSDRGVRYCCSGMRVSTSVCSFGFCGAREGSFYPHTRDRYVALSHQ